MTKMENFGQMMLLREIALVVIDIQCRVQHGRMLFFVGNNKYRYYKL